MTHYLFDVTALLMRARVPVMTGIDRVEFAIVTAMLEAVRRGAAEAGFLIVSPAGKWVLRSDVMARQIEAMGQRRGLGAQPGPLLDTVLDALAAEMPQGPPVARFVGPQSYPRRARRIIDVATLIAGHGTGLARYLSRAGRVHYVHASHRGFRQPAQFAWLRDHRVDATFFIHDLIPLDFPDFCGVGARLNAQAGIALLAEVADRIATPSIYSSERLQHWLAKASLPAPPISVHRLGAGQLLPGSRPPQAALQQGIAPFWLCIGTIEGRKNVEALLTAWRRDAALHGERLPRLVLAGARGWQNAKALAALDTDPILARHVIEVDGLNDAELAVLIQHACGVLTPSLVEGFSLAPAEAAALGRPALVSPIPAHLELAGESSRVQLLTPEWSPTVLPESGGQASAGSYRTWQAFGAGFVSWLADEARC